MDVKYQVAILGPCAKQFQSALRRTIRKRLKELDPNLPNHVRIFGSSTAGRYDPKSPSVGIYFGGKNHAGDDLSLLRRMIRAAAVVIPVVTDISQYHTLVPKELLPINGAELRDSDLGAIANVALENLRLLRQDRRLFISYRRADSSTVALQLRHLLEARGYDAFLDTHSVPLGDPFQEVLWQRLADSDLLLLLDSPNFLKSRWTKEELAQAEALTVGILQIIWPGHTPAPYTDLCERIYLGNGDFKGKSLRKSVLAKIAARVESLRARCLAARHNNLVREFCDAAATIGVKTAVQSERFVLADLKNGRRVAAIPAVGVPDALRYHEASVRFPSGGKTADEAVLVYDHRGLRPSWSAFLEWLDQFLPVKAIRVTMVAARLGGP